MDRLILFLIPLPLLAFWLWMFYHMMNNARLTNQQRLYWTVAFFFLSLIAAGLYYVEEYRQQ